MALTNICLKNDYLKQIYFESWKLQANYGMLYTEVNRDGYQIVPTIQVVKGSNGLVKKKHHSYVCKYCSAWNAFNERF